MSISKRLTTTSSLMLAIFLPVILSVTVVAQSSTGSISGTVKDVAGAAIGGAEVSLVHSQAVLRTTVTSADGKIRKS